MLELTRTTGKSIIINDNITVTILEVNGHQVKLGIDAPKHIPVNREEVHERILQGTPPPKGNFKNSSAYRY